MTPLDTEKAVVGFFLLLFILTWGLVHSCPAFFPR
jgi:hypothetical protein